MEAFAFFGKGGIGKSTISSNVSAVLGIRGFKVLHVGCDPKMDSSLALTGRATVPFSVAGLNSSEPILRQLITKSPYIANVDCIEAGGPEPGLGCAGVAIGNLLDAIHAEQLTENGSYECMIFDVLGDVVCGGFAAPLKRGFAKKAIIVTSEELLSLYAANNLLKMLNNYSRNGVFAAGIALNVRNPEEIKNAERYAQAVGLKILATIHRDPAVYEAAKQHQSVLLTAPKSLFSRNVMKLTFAIEQAVKPTSLPRPLTEDEFYKFTGNNGSFSQLIKQKDVVKKVLSKQYLSQLNLTVHGISDGKVLLRYCVGGLEACVVVCHNSEAKKGMRCYSDWAAYVLPKLGEVINMPQELLHSLEQISFAKYSDIFELVVKNIDYANAVRGLSGKPHTTSHGITYPDFFNASWSKFAFYMFESKNTPTPVHNTIDYADIECAYNGSAHGGLLGQFDLPRNKKNIQPHLPYSGVAMASSYFSLSDCVSGKYTNLQNSIRKMCGSLSGERYLEIMLGCSPVLLSQDLEDFLKAEEKFNNTKFFVEEVQGIYDTGKKYGQDRINTMLSNFKNADKTKRYDICLVDYDEPTAELSSILSKLGLSVILQKEYFSPEPLSAHLTVLANHSPLKETAFAQAGIPFVCPACPYGFNGTTNWLRAIFAKYSLLYPERQLIYRDLAQGLRQEENKLRNRLSDYAVAFIVEKQDLPLLQKENTDFLAGITLPFVLDSGMDTLLLVKTQNKNDILPELRFSYNASNLKIKTFSSQKELHFLLTENQKLKFVYTDLRYDERVYIIGKKPFSSSILEYGYSGALETLKRFVELASAIV